MIDKINQLVDENRQLTLRIDLSSDQDEIYELQKKLYQNKIQIIEYATTNATRSGIKASKLRHIVENKPKVPRYATGISALDDALLGGIEIGTLVQLAGQSFTGKTHLALEVLSHVAKSSKCVFFNFEMGDYRIVKRLNDLLKEDNQWDNLLVDKDSRRLTDLCNEIRLHAMDGIKFFVIDSKMKIEVETKDEDHKKFGQITKELSKITQQNDVIIFLINQMSEDDQKHGRLAFKGGGDQQYDSDISLFYMKDKEGNRTLVCNKNRQDDKEFSLKLKLDFSGRTVACDAPDEVKYEMPVL